MNKTKYEFPESGAKVEMVKTGERREVWEKPFAPNCT